MVIKAEFPNTLAMGTPAEVQVTMMEEGELVEGAEVELEGNMTHAGMEPIFADAEEVTPGTYVAELDWTMSGQWLVTVHATLMDGREVEQTFRNLEVRSQ
ncbi:MAG: FixH family protein [Chloroflexota bacterium]|nr:FixH family protein [Chloroflexota bacterium]